MFLWSQSRRVKLVNLLIWSMVFSFNIKYFSLIFCLRGVDMLLRLFNLSHLGSIQKQLSTDACSSSILIGRSAAVGYIFPSLQVQKAYIYDHFFFLSNFANVVELCLESCLAIWNNVKIFAKIRSLTCFSR